MKGNEKQLSLTEDETISQHHTRKDELVVGSHCRDDSKFSDEDRTDDGPQCEAENSISDVNYGGKETKAINMSKTILYIILALGAIPTAVATWFFVRQVEENQFEAEFVIYGTQVLRRADEKSRTIIQQIHTLSTAFTSRSLDSNEDFPHVVMPHFNVHSRELANLSGASQVLYAPLVDINAQGQWEEWVWQNQEKILSKTFGTLGASFVAIAPAVYQIPDDALINIDLSLTFEKTFVSPILQFGPDALSNELINLDLNSHPALQQILQDAIKVSHTMLSEVFDMTFLLRHTSGTRDISPDPFSIVAEPVYNSFDEANRSIAGFVIAVEPWGQFFTESLPDHVSGFVVNVHSSCDSDHTFKIDGRDVVFIVNEDLHDTRYDDLGLYAEFAPFARYDGDDDGARHCDFSLHVYPSKAFEESYFTYEPYLYAVLMLAVFCVTVSVFVVYDFLVTRRQKKVVASAINTTEIIRSLFTKQVGDRIIAESEEKETSQVKIRPGRRLEAFVSRILDYEDGRDRESGILKSEPIAELYTDTTVMFADIVGFTAWCSMREPKQVFHLLETIYSDFDQKATRRGVFKVETIGDCYVAVVGIPRQRKDHCSVMARFARECVHDFAFLCRQLEEALGPETSDLAIRVGLHSGPVTAGVLRGDRARFQLFGDTVNTAARIESTGKPNEIHISQETADLLKNNGKEHWVVRRENLIVAKGKGELQTYWLTLGSDEPDRSSTSGSQSVQRAKYENDWANKIAVDIRRPEPVLISFGTKKERLVRWNSDILSKLLASIIGRRSLSESTCCNVIEIDALERDIMTKNEYGIMFKTEDVICFPRSDLPAEIVQPENLSDQAKEQLYAYINALSNLHRDNPYHNFEHGSHVMMALTMLFNRVRFAKKISADIDQSLGLVDDDVILFAAALSALMIGIDHPGFADSAHENGSISEQDALDKSWRLLMSPIYADLRRAIYTTQTELKRFRQLVIHSLLACCKDNQATTTIPCNAAIRVSSRRDSNLRECEATVVFEIVVQVAHASHTMQHWATFLKWNRRLFEESCIAFDEGRTRNHPADSWYDLEIQNFDNFVLPLAQKLKETGVLGVFADEYLELAMNNRNQWVAKGKQLVQEMKRERAEKSSQK